MSQENRDVFPLKARRIRRRALVTLLLGGLVTGLIGTIFLAEPALLTEPRVGPMHVAGLCGVFFFIQSILRLIGSGQAAIRLGPVGLEYPRSISFLRGGRIQYSDINLLLAPVRGRHAQVVVGTPRRNLVISSDMLESPDDVVWLEQAVRQRIVAEAGGSARLYAMAQDLEATRRLFQRRALATEILVGLCLAGYVLELLTGAVHLTQFLGGRVGPLVELGANVASLVREGEWHRLITSTFLHGGHIHIGLNVLALLALGGLLERVLGAYRLTLIYLASALAGAVGTTWVTQAWLSVGASGAVFGLLGALAALQYRFGSRLPVGFGQTRNWWFFVIALNGVLALIPQIDMFAHVGGFIMGGGLALVLARRPEHLQVIRGTPWTIKACTMALMGLFAAAIATGWSHYGEHQSGRKVLIEALSESASPDPDTVNWIAWEIVTDPEAEVGELKAVARDLASILVDHAERHDARDTLATAFHRLRERDRALAEELKVFEERADNFIATQLLRFARGSDRDQPPLGLEGSASATVSPGQHQSVRVEGFERMVRTLFLRVVRGEDEVGLMRLILDPDVAEYTAATSSTEDEERPAYLPGFVHELSRNKTPVDELMDSQIIPIWKTLRFEPLIGLDWTHGNQPSGTWRFWPVDPAVEALPD